MEGANNFGGHCIYKSEREQRCQKKLCQVYIPGQNEVPDWLVVALGGT